MTDDATYPEPDLSLVGAEHIAQYEATGGRVGHDWNNTQCLIAHTIGRRTGRAVRHRGPQQDRQLEQRAQQAPEQAGPARPGWCGGP